MESEHNPAFDHEAFLGEDAKSFDQLTPDESRAKLSEIVDKMDTDHDKTVTQEELRAWIHKAQKNYILDDVDRQWKSHNPDGLEQISWADYRRVTYGFIEELADNSVNEDSKTYKEMIRRDRRRWELADENGDDHLTKDEFINFLHPEESEHMRAVVVEETLEDIDKNHDGKISLDEYISDMYAPDASDDQIPDWVAREKEQFGSYRDKNKD
jgi:Ca2+-binding EF-hand superfamily protein